MTLLTLFAQAAQGCDANCQLADDPWTQVGVIFGVFLGIGFVVWFIREKGPWGRGWTRKPPRR